MDQETQRLLIENLKIAKENRDYLIKIDRRQRWDRNWRAFYWAVIVFAAVFGGFYAFPYLKDAREKAVAAWSQVYTQNGFMVPKGQ